MTYSLDNAWIGVGERRLLSNFTWSVKPGSVVVVCGPVGTGKSTLLRVLSGRRSPDLQIGGTWIYDGQDFAEVWEKERPPSSIAWVPQIRQAPAGEFKEKQLEEAIVRVDSAFACGARTALLDEPARGLPEPQQIALADRMRRFTRAGGTAVVVTHNVAFARRVADQVCLLFDGRCEAIGDAPSFFDDPPTPRAGEFVEHGSCAPPLPEPPCVPSHFRWVIDEQLAGMGKPGLLRDFDVDLFAVASAGITLLISVTEERISPVRLRPYGIEGRHIPCRDMGVPSMRDALAACKAATKAMAQGERVAVHCRAGLGRTGTLLACILTRLGRTPQQAISELRTLCARYIQSDAQLRFISDFGQEFAT